MPNIDATVARLNREKRKAELKGNLKEVSKICNALGDVYMEHDDYVSALDEHKMGLSISKSLADVMSAAVAHRRIGECYAEQGEYALALRHQKLHLKAAREAGELTEEQRAQATLGRTHLYQAESEPESNREALKKAEIAFVASLELCERLRSTIAARDYTEMKARLWLNLGLVYDNRGNVKYAVTYIKKAIQAAERYSLHEDLYRCQFSLAGIYQKNAEPRNAIRPLQTALQCARKLQNLQFEREVLSQQALLFLLLGDLAAAKRSAKRAYSIVPPPTGDLKKLLCNVVKMSRLCCELLKLKSSAWRMKMKLSEQIADKAADIGQFAFAIRHYKTMRECAHNLDLSSAERIPIYVSLAQTYMDLRDYHQAAKCFREEINCRKDDDYEQLCRTWLNLADASERDGASYSALRDMYGKALSAAGKCNHRHLQRRVLNSLIALQTTFKQDTHRQVTEHQLQKLGHADSRHESDNEDSQGVSDTHSDSSVSDFTHSDDSNEEFDRGSRPAMKGVTGRARRAIQVKRNELGETPLHRACIQGNLKKARALLDEGHPVNPRDYCGWLPIHEAANHGHADIVALLLSHGASVNDRGGELCGGVTPLLDAAANGKTAVVQILVEKGAKVYVKDDQGNTPISNLIEYKANCENDLRPDELAELRATEKLLRKKINVTGQNDTSDSDVPSTAVANITSHEQSSDSDSDSLPDIKAMRTSRKRRTLSRIQEDPDESSELVPVTSGDTCDRQVELASESYRDAMAGVGSAATRSLNSDPKPPPPSRSHSSLTPFIHEDDYVGDDWLVDDIVAMTRPSKRQRVEDTRRFEVSTPRPAQPRGSRQLRVDEFGTRQEEPPREVSSEDNRNVRREDMTVRREVTAMMRLRVKIAGKVIMVPVSEQAHTIEWLATEAANRYFRLCHRRPELSLTTKDGALLSPEDLVTALLSNDEEVLAVVNKWELPPLTTRYNESCSRLATPQYKNIRARLQNSINTCSVELDKLCLTSSQLLPVARALQYEQTLTHIHLAGNRMGNKGLRSLCEVAGTLPHLSFLDVSCNEISAAGLKSMAEIMSKEQKSFQMLETFNISHNFLGDESALSLSTILQHMPSLATLRMRACDFTKKLFQTHRIELSESLRAHRINAVDVAHNALGSMGIELLLKCCRPSHIRTLDLSDNICSYPDNHFLRHLLSYVAKAGCVLENLVLDGCYLTDQAIPDLCRLVGQTASLEKLSLSVNPELSISVVSRVLTTAASNPCSHLTTVHCCGCSTDGEDLRESIRSKLHHVYPLCELIVTSSSQNIDDISALWIDRWAQAAILNLEPASGLIKLAVKSV